MKTFKFNNQKAILNISWDGTMFVSFLNPSLGLKKKQTLIENNFPLKRVILYLYASHQGWLVQRVKDAVEDKDFTLSWGKVFIG